MLFDKKHNDETAPAPNGGAADKVAKFGWTLSGKPGVYLDVAKGDLCVDHTYQRDNVSQTTITTIAGNFNWVSFGVLLVVLRNDNEMFVIDGQHRLLAALKRSDIQKVPCLVFEEIGVKGEAAAFKSVNESRKAVSSIDKFKAAIIAEDPIAIEIRGFLERHGLTVSSTRADGTLDCINHVTSLYNTNAAALDMALPTVIAANEGQVIHQMILSSVFHIAQKYPESFKNPAVQSRIVRAGRKTLLAACNRATSIYGTSGRRIWATGIITDIINKGARTNKIVLETA